MGSSLGIVARPRRRANLKVVVCHLLKQICSNPAEAMSDRDALKRKKSLPLITEGAIRARKLIFRNMFIREEDAKIAKVLWNYFTAIALRWPIAWNQKQRGLILNRTTGYRALMQFLPIVILSLDLIDKVPDVSLFEGVFAKVNLNDDQLNSDDFKPGSSGQSQLRHTLQLQTRLTDETIWPSGRRQQSFRFGD
jgi:hypothetical protein